MNSLFFPRKVKSGLILIWIFSNLGHGIVHQVALPFFLKKHHLCVSVRYTAFRVRSLRVSRDAIVAA